MHEIETMSLYEYGVRMKAHELKRLDEECRDHWNAWLNARVNDTKQAGRDKVIAKYGTFEDFFDYEKRFRAIGECVGTTPSQEKRLKEVARRVQKFNEGRRSDGEL